MFDFQLITEDIMSLDEELSNIISDFFKENVLNSISELLDIKQIYLGVDIIIDDMKRYENFY